MDKKAFIDAVREVVAEAAVADSTSLMRSPPGRRPRAELVALSQWYNDLDADPQRRVHDVVAMAVHSAVFGFLCVLDGVRSIESGGQKGRLELVHITGATRLPLNDASGDELHDLFGPDWPRPRV